MKAIIDYKKENSELTGSIMVNEYAGRTTYIALQHQQVKHTNL